MVVWIIPRINLWIIFTKIKSDPFLEGFGWMQVFVGVAFWGRAASPPRPLIVRQRYFSKRKAPTISWTVWHPYIWSSRAKRVTIGEVQLEIMSTERPEEDTAKSKSLDDQLTELESIPNRNAAAEERFSCRSITSFSSWKRMINWVHGSIMKFGSEKVSIDRCKLTRCAAEQKDLGREAAKLPKCVIRKVLRADEDR